MTNDERIVRLLEEMHDAQRQQLELARAALANQEKAIASQLEMQNMAKRRLRAVPFLIIVALFLVIGILLLMFYRIM